MANSEKVVVDGANIAYIEQTSGGKPKVSNIIAVRRALMERGYKPIIIIDASLHHEVDDPQQLEGLIDGQTVHQAPAGVDADYFVLETAEAHDALVVSNDEFEDREDKYPWIRERRVPLMIVNGDVMLYSPAMK